MVSVDDIAITLHKSVNYKIINNLIDLFRSAESVYSASLSELIERGGLAPHLAREIKAKPYHYDANAELKYMMRYGIEGVVSTDSDYPPLLKEINNYPHLMYYKGDMTPFRSGKILSVVGTRHATDYGQKMCDRIIGELAQVIPDLVVVSGLASGIDGYAHRAALSAGVKTFGVLGSAIDESKIISNNRIIAKNMMRSGGGVISEYNSSYKVVKSSFLHRNRIIAGMAMATLVVEAPLKSGALNTAHTAHSYDRDVFAVPGRADMASSAGVNNLIRVNVANITESAKDIIDILGWGEESVSLKSDIQELNLSEASSKILNIIKEGENLNVDDLSVRSGMDFGELMECILDLELAGYVRYGAGNILVLK